MSDDQSALLTAIYTEDPGSFNLDALAIYKGNLEAHAKNVLIVSFPTLYRLIGEGLAALAADYLKKYPHNGSDWGEWGGALATFLASYPALKDYAYLPDIAQLDWLQHQCERAANREFSADNLMNIGECDLENTTFLLAPGLAIIESKFPVVSLYKAHNQSLLEHNSRVLDDVFTEVKQKLANNIGETAVIWRKQLKGLVDYIDQKDANWLNLIDNGHSISSALDLIDDDFDFSQWFSRAIEQGHIFSLKEL